MTLGNMRGEHWLDLIRQVELACSRLSATALAAATVAATLL